jgi:hypothetical protein
MPDLWAASDPRERACAMFDVVISGDGDHPGVFRVDRTRENLLPYGVVHPLDELRSVSAGESWPSSWRWTLPPSGEQP